MTSFVPSGNVASTWISGIISGTPSMTCDRASARGFRLNIPAGTAVRFEPGQERTVELVELGGARTVYGFAGQVMGPLDAARP